MSSRVARAWRQAIRSSSAVVSSSRGTSPLEPRLEFPQREAFEVGLCRAGRSDDRNLDAGQRVWLVTATPVELATIIARRLGLTGALGTVAESIDGVYTGRLVGEMLHGPAKAHAVRALAAREGLDLRRCTAYSDSANDVPMLSVVGTAVAVNPDSGLRETARKRGWEIRDFRTGRKAAKIGVPSVLGAGAVAGAVAVGLAYRKREHAS